MRLDNTLPRWARPFAAVSHPFAILPVAILVSLWFGSYTPEQITGLQEVPRFLQGSTDMGGSDIFAATLAMYVVFGTLGAIRAVLRMHAAPAAGSYWQALRANLVDLKWHIFVFIVGGTACWDYDSYIGPNDFRNMFFFAALVYAVSAGAVTAIGRLPVPFGLRLGLAPVVIYAWLWLGWDGNTAKSGQVLASHDDPVYLPQSEKHRAMLRWHETVDRWLGDH